MADHAIESRRRNVRPSLFVFIAGSAALHAALLGFVPGFSEKRQEPVRLSALEVVMRVSADSQPLAAEEPVPPSAQTARPRTGAHGKPPREMDAAAAQSGVRARPEVALPGSTDAPADANSAREAATARASETLTTAAAGKAAAPAVASAAYLDNPAPRYPDAARRLGQEGTVMLRVLVAVDGAPARVTVERSSGSPHLDGAALERVRSWQFKPASQGPTAIESWVIVPIVFRLESAS